MWTTLIATRLLLQFNDFTFLLRRQWNIKITNPWRELKMANMYLNATVDELKLRSPNNQVIPSKGSMTAVALSPALTFSTCVLFWTCRVPIICRITKTKTTMLICGETSLSVYAKTLASFTLPTIHLVCCLRCRLEFQAAELQIMQLSNHSAKLPASLLLIHVWQAHEC